jgi:hypothetical protein
LFPKLALQAPLIKLDGREVKTSVFSMVFELTIRSNRNYNRLSGSLMKQFGKSVDGTLEEEGDNATRSDDGAAITQSEGKGEQAFPRPEWARKRRAACLPSGEKQPPSS